MAETINMDVLFMCIDINFNQYKGGYQIDK